MAPTCPPKPTPIIVPHGCARPRHAARSPGPPTLVYPLLCYAFHLSPSACSLWGARPVPPPVFAALLALRYVWSSLPPALQVVPPFPSGIFLSLYPPLHQSNSASLPTVPSYQPSFSSFLTPFSLSRCKIRHVGAARELGSCGPLSAELSATGAALRTSDTPEVRHRCVRQGNQELQQLGLLRAEPDHRQLVSAHVGLSCVDRLLRRAWLVTMRCCHVAPWQVCAKQTAAQ